MTRLFNSREKDAVAVAKASLAVRAEHNDPLPSMSLPRSVFAPEEKIPLRIRWAKSWDEAYIELYEDNPASVIQQDLKPAGKRYYLKWLLKGGEQPPYAEFNAPRTPGDYAIHLLARDHSKARTLALVRFSVREIVPSGEPGEARAAIEPQYFPGQPLKVAYTIPGGWPYPHFVLRRQGREEPLTSRLYLGKSKAGLMNVKDFLFEAGEYELILYKDTAITLSNKVENEDFRVLTLPFSVVPAPWEEKLEPSLALRSGESTPKGGVRVTFTARRDWSDTAWVGIVPAGTPEEAPTAWAAATHKELTRNRACASYDLSSPDTPGNFEVRLYSGKYADSMLAASPPLRVLNAEEIRAGQAAVDKEVDALLAEPPLAPVRIGLDDATFKKLFRVPTMVYTKLRADIDAEIDRWSGGSQKCDRKFLREEGKRMACVLVSRGEDAYLDLALSLAKGCEWKLEDQKLADREYKRQLAELEKIRLDRENKVVTTMERISKRDVLHCLCKAGDHDASSNVQIGYHPSTMKDCIDTGGPCIAKGYGCWRFNMATDHFALHLCGAFAAVEAYKKERQGGATQ